MLIQPALKSWQSLFAIALCFWVSGCGGHPSDDKDTLQVKLSIRAILDQLGRTPKEHQTRNVMLVMYSDRHLARIARRLDGHEAFDVVHRYHLPYKKLFKPEWFRQGKSFYVLVSPHYYTDKERHKVTVTVISKHKLGQHSGRFTYAYQDDRWILSEYKPDVHLSTLPESS